MEQNLTLNIRGINFIFVFQNFLFHVLLATRYPFYTLVDYNHI